MTTETGVRGETKQRSIQSVEVGFRLISCLVDHSGAISLKDLSACADMSPSKAHLYLNSFRNIGLVTQDKRGHYKLGPYAVQLGIAALARLDVIEEAREELERLRDETGESVFLSVWSGRGACIVAKEDGLRDSPLMLRIGSFLPLLRSATGRVFFSYLPRASTEAEVAEAVAELRALGLPRIELTQLIEEVRQHGMARTESQLNFGFIGMAAPVFSHDGSLAAVLSLVAPSGGPGVDSSCDGPTARSLRKAAARISERLGYSDAELS